MLRFRVAAALALTLAPMACPTQNSDNADCRSVAECGAAEAPCAGCPPVGAALCNEGVCEERGADEIDVTGDVSLDRDIAGGVASFVHVLAAGTTGNGAFSCASAFEAGRVASDVNVLAAGYKAVSGGSFHPDVSLGRAPAGPVAVLIVATSDSAGQGEVLGTGCVEPREPSGGALDVEVIQVRP